MKIALTGGSGRLGRAVLPILLQNGHLVRSLDWNADLGLQELFPQVEWITQDLTDHAGVLESLQGIDGVIHLAAYPGPQGHAPGVVYRNNTTTSYNVLSAASQLGIRQVCQASSINALGGIGSRVGRFDYFPVDEKHPTYNADDYSLSKWVMELQADSFARRTPQMTISSLRFHALPDEPPELHHSLDTAETPAARGLWGWTLIAEAARACLLAVEADFKGHEIFFITAPRTYSAIPSLELAKYAYPEVPVRSDLSGHRSFFNCSKAAQLLGWAHLDV